jgi:hypothetical protein
VLLQATGGSAFVVLFAVLQLGTWMMAGDDVPILRLRWMKLATLGSDDHQEDPRPAFYKLSLDSHRLRRPGSLAQKASLYAIVLSQISV